MQFDAWGDALRATCGYFDPVPATRQKAVNGHFVTHRLNALDVADFRCDIRQIRRSLRDIRSDDHEHLFLLVQVEGRSLIETGETRSVVEPGMLYLLDSTRPLTIAYDGGVSHALSVHLPRAAVLAGAVPALRVGTAIDAGSPAARLLQRQITGLIGGKVAAAAAARAGAGDPDQMFDLVRLAFHPGGAGQPVTGLRGATRFALAMRAIETHVTHPDLSLPWLAARLGISPRQLERDFSAHDTSFVRALRRQRLKLFAELARIASRRGQRPQITDIALASGFRDISNFNRAFRSEYGQTPRRFMEAASRSPRAPRAG
ncbi:MAG: helix-turn-helix domain-containing protein [Paracoccus sp. (in: a-proteobacteria)]|uniref:helix-turn-helix domain-containing protein n=1 Tax=Paracoccus sp. TaxID=267 RepID=UPI0026DEEE23|nr:helix-turn-helix domain-containing protein [Paracoccus sp. (in: a-proteobacteria)]MDO5620020.1 helix-turn-helix domain-containing protein [Paracoccus sp. (in: a-proteobacteria)]